MEPYLRCESLRPTNMPQKLNPIRFYWLANLLIFLLARTVAIDTWTHLSFSQLTCYAFRYYTWHSCMLAIWEASLWVRKAKNPRTSPTSERIPSFVRKKIPPPSSDRAHHQQGHENLGVLAPGQQWGFANVMVANFTHWGAQNHQLTSPSKHDKKCRATFIFNAMFVLEDGFLFLQLVPESQSIFLASRAGMDLRHCRSAVFKWIHE